MRAFTVTPLMARPRALRAAGIALLCTTLGACDLAFSGFREQVSDTWTRSYPLAANGRLEVVNTNGFIRVDAVDGSTVEVSAERIAKAATAEAAKELLQRVEIGEEIAPDRVHLETKRPSGSTSGFGRGGVEVRYTIKVPRTAQVDLRATNGGVTVNGITNGAQLSTTNGGIDGKALGGEVRASTTNGGIDLDLASFDKPLRASTTNGGVDVRVPADAKADVDARCTNGGIDVNGFDFAADGERTRRRVSGRVNGGGPRLEVSTTNGGITISAKR